MQERGFSFLTSNSEFNTPEKQSGSSQIKQQVVLVATAAIVGAVFGMRTKVFLGDINSSELSLAERNALVASLEKLRSKCDLVGIKLDDGIVNLRLAIDADKISNESIVELFAVIHQQAHDFKKFASVIMYNTKFPVLAFVFVIFDSHKRAKLFIENYAGKCRHHAFRISVKTEPWVIDLENEEITMPYKFMHSLFQRSELDRMQARFFHKDSRV